MRIFERGGERCLWYDKAHAQIAAMSDAICRRPDHDCTDHAPPREAEVIAFLERLAPDDRVIVLFLGVLVHSQFRIPIHLWPEGSLPLEELLAGSDRP